LIALHTCHFRCWSLEKNWVERFFYFYLCEPSENIWTDRNTESRFGCFFFSRTNCTLRKENAHKNLKPPVYRYALLDASARRKLPLNCTYPMRSMSPKK
jgi:hypothetical protein